MVDDWCEHRESEVDWDPIMEPPPHADMDITYPNEKQANQMHTVKFREEHLSQAAQTVVMTVIREAIMARFFVAPEKVVHKVQVQAGSSIANSLRVILPQVRKLETAFINAQGLDNEFPRRALSTRPRWNKELQSQRRAQKCNMLSHPLFAEASKAYHQNLWLHGEKLLKVIGQQQKDVLEIIAAMRLSPGADCGSRQIHVDADSSTLRGVA